VFGGVVPTVGLLGREIKSIHTAGTRKTRKFTVPVALPHLSADNENALSIPDFWLFFFTFSPLGLGGRLPLRVIPPPLFRFSFRGFISFIIFTLYIKNLNELRARRNYICTRAPVNRVVRKSFVQAPRSDGNVTETS